MTYDSSAAVDFHLGTTFLEEPRPNSHAVQFYETDAFLVDAVGRFLGAGLRAGESIVVIASDAHAKDFMDHLESLGGARAMESGQLVMLDAQETLAKFMVGDMPDHDLFMTVINVVITCIQKRHPGARLRCYGEMVDLLWREGNSRAAIRLEELWNELREAQSFVLLCAYVMGNFYKEGDAAQFMEVCRTHSDVISTESFAANDDPCARLHELSLLRQRTSSLESEVRYRKELELALRDALQERTRVEDELRAAVVREKAARARAEENDSFKEMFLGILGHDLRNPLSAILTTARLMTVRGEGGPDNEKRVGRIVSSGVRMQRMIEQILDLTRARLAEGIPVNRSVEHDLTPIVTRIVEELRGAELGHRIELVLEGPCRAHVDPDRLEQVVSNLLGNALAHGDPEQPITVTLASRVDAVSVTVHNHGTPIDPHFMPLLFDPFRRGDVSNGRAQGLGLGLYIAERIASAHGGKIEVQSSQVLGTSFAAVFPCT
ncbi:MAG: ATP-binding protein [Minicystis sp.]